MKWYKLEQDIKKKGLTRDSLGYTGISPISVDNDLRTISIEQESLDKWNTEYTAVSPIEINKTKQISLNTYFLNDLVTKEKLRLGEIDSIKTNFLETTKGIQITELNSTQVFSISGSNKEITIYYGSGNSMEPVSDDAITNVKYVKDIQAQQDILINQKLYISDFDTFKTENTQAINNGDTNTLQQAKEYTNQQTSLTITTNEFAIPNKTFMGKQVYCKYFDTKEYNTSTNNILVSGVERIVSIDFERKRNDNYWLYIPANSSNANQVLLRDNNTISLWILDFNLGGNFTKWCRVYVEYTKL